jgi:hypothetical protein
MALKNSSIETGTSFESCNVSFGMRVAKMPEERLTEMELEREHESGVENWFTWKENGKGWRCRGDGARVEEDFEDIGGDSRVAASNKTHDS